MLKAEAEGCSVLRGAERRGEGGIRTPDAGITDVTVFETAAFNHSATSPRQSVSTAHRHFNRASRRAILHPNTISRLEGCSDYVHPVVPVAALDPVQRSRMQKTCIQALFQDLSGLNSCGGLLVKY